MSVYYSDRMHANINQALDKAHSALIETDGAIRYRDIAWDDSGDRPPSPPARLLHLEGARGHLEQALEALKKAGGR